MTAFIHFELKSCQKFTRKIFWGMTIGLCMGNLLLLCLLKSGMSRETDRIGFLQETLGADDAFSLAPPPMDFNVRAPEDSKDTQNTKAAKGTENLKNEKYAAANEGESEEKDDDFLLPPPLEVPFSNGTPQNTRIPQAAEHSKPSENWSNKNKTYIQQTPNQNQSAKPNQTALEDTLFVEAPAMDFGEKESEEAETAPDSKSPASARSKVKKRFELNDSDSENLEAPKPESSDFNLNDLDAEDLDAEDLDAEDPDADDFLTIKAPQTLPKESIPDGHSENAAENSNMESLENSPSNRAKESPESQNQTLLAEPQTNLDSAPDIDFSFLEVKEKTNENEKENAPARTTDSANPNPSAKPDSQIRESVSLDTKIPTETEQVLTPKKKKKVSIPESTPEEIELRKKILTTLRIYDQISLCTEENRPIDVISYTIPYGCDARIFMGPREENKKVNAIYALCWNIPMGEESAFSTNKEKLVPRLGYGIQQYAGQLLAAFAIARVSIDYRFPASWASLDTQNTKNAKNTNEAGQTEQENRNQQDIFSLESPPGSEKPFGIQDLIEFEKKNCRWEKDLSHTLIALSYYLPSDAEWTAGDGETWTLERIVQNELERPMELGEAASANQLLGLLCAIRCWQMHTNHAPLTGSYEKAQAYLLRFQKFVLDIQNDIGVWHPEFFKKKGVTPYQSKEMLLASGHILRWLVTITPRNELNDPRIFKAVQTLNELLEFQLTYWDPSNASSTEIEGIMAALHALTIYESRRFKKAARKRQ